MELIKPPSYFCSTSEMRRDTDKEYAQSALGSLPDHIFLSHTQNSAAYNECPKDAPADNPLKIIIKVYVDDYIYLVIP